MKLFILVLALTLVFSASAGDAYDWRSRSIYQLLTDRYARSDRSDSPCANLSNYCGGTFEGIRKNLDYIKAMGFDAIWISPIVENYEGGYHGYWATNLYKVNKHFGTTRELKKLVNAAHSKDILVMVDVVANHMGPVGTNFSQIVPFNLSEHYHPRCLLTNWTDQHHVENCWLADLPDLDQNSPFVKRTLIDWIRHLVAEFKFDGIRIDTILEVPANFWLDFTRAAGVFAMGEAFHAGYQYVGGYQNVIDGVLNYPLYYKLKEIFGAKQSMSLFTTHYVEMGKHFKNQDLLGNFVDNHDNSRFLNEYNDTRMFKAALAFTIASRGIPFTYYGFEHNFDGGADPLNREVFWTTKFKPSSLTKFVKTLHEVRKATRWYDQPQIESLADDSFYAFSRGSTFFAFTNRPDEKQVRTITSHPYHEGQMLCNIFEIGDCVRVRNNTFPVELNNGEVKIFVPDYGAKELLKSYFS